MSGVPKIARQRNMTAREAAKRFGKSPRTIRRYVALDRDVYEDRAAARREQAHNLRQQGMSWAAVGEAMGGISADAARMLAARHKPIDAKKATQ